ncbi:MAG TPA: SGNH/GDSL hydrolase family protein [Polyangiaceae bacterium]|nr:SGNH/GDSL hydrolase family protein [Polyangiaceae bacterium]
MISRQQIRLGLLVAVGLTSYGFTGCSSSSTPDASTGGFGSTTGGTANQGGQSTGGVIGTGGVQTGGLPSTGGTTGGFATGGTATATGGVATGGVATGGTATGGAPTGGVSSGGAGKGGESKGGAGGTPAGGTGGSVTGTGGAAKGGAGNTGGAATGGAATGGSGGGTCQKGQVKASEVVIMGESFYAIAPQYIQKRIQDNARKAGSLGANESYRNVAVSGQNMNYIATTEWTAATQGGASVKFVIMDGGGIDCLSGGSTCSSCANTFKTLLGKMATAGVQDVIYTRYPEPGAPPGSNASLKACLDSTMPSMQTTCQGSTAPRCHWLDLRPVWVTGDTTDGLHPTQSGGDHVGDLIWSEMVKLCLAQ